METKNAIIMNYANAIVTAANDTAMVTSLLNDNPDENLATVATLNVILESIRSHTVLLQQALDKYK